MVPRTLAILGATSTLKIPTSTSSGVVISMMGPPIAPPCRITLPGSKFSTQLEGAPLVANGLTMLFNDPAFSSPLAQNSMCHTRNVDCLLFPMMCVCVSWRLLCKHCDSPQFPSDKMLYRMCFTIACMCIHLVPANSE